MAAEMIGGGRPVRICIACSGEDDHPRHEVVTLDGLSAGFHFDCHARMSPPCPICLVGAADGKTGSDLLDHILANSGG